MFKFLSIPVPKHLLCRLVHFPESFDAAKDWCRSVNGELLQLKNVEEVMAALGNSMQGNAEEFRIDGWAEGTWYHK